MPQLPQTPSLAPLADLENLDGYRRMFTDPLLWHPYIEEVCRRHSLLPCQRVRVGVAGTYPTFIVDERWVLKFFGQLFEGEQAFEAEWQVNRIIGQEDFLAPAMIHEGYLNQNQIGWRWPYLVFEFLPGVSVGEVFEQISFEDRLTLAQELGELTRRLHDLRLDKMSLQGPSKAFPPDWKVYIQFLRQSYQQSWAAQTAAALLPRHLFEQVQDFVVSPEALVDQNHRPHLIHADLTRDHILGRIVNQHWQTRGIIDWGDAMIGNYLYELLALHLDLFHADKRLLLIYLDAYGLEEAARRKLPRQALSLALMHRFNILEPTLRDFPHLRESRTLSEMAAILWEV